MEKAMKMQCSTKVSVVAPPCHRASFRGKMASAPVNEYSRRGLRVSLKVSAAKGEAERGRMVGEWGARDATAAEIESGFADKTVGNWDTDHILRMPQELGQKLFSLKEKDCTKERGETAAEMDQLLVWQKSVADWKIIDVDGTNRIRCEWKVKNFNSGLEFFNRVAELAEAQGHHPDLHLVGWNKLSIELWSHSAGGLTENDFIMAYKIDAMEKADLLPKPKPKKQRFWA